MSCEQFTGRKVVNLTIMGVAFWFLGKKLFEATLRRPSHWGRTRVVTEETVDLLPYESEREAARVFTALYPDETITFEPFDVLLDSDEYKGEDLHQKRMTPDFSIHGIIVEVGFGSQDSRQKQDQAKIAELAGLSRYFQIVGPDLYNLLSSSDPRTVIAELSNGLLK